MVHERHKRHGADLERRLLDFPPLAIQTLRGDLAAVAEAVRLQVMTTAEPPYITNAPEVRAVLDLVKRLDGELVTAMLTTVTPDVESWGPLVALRLERPAARFVHFPSELREAFPRSGEPSRSARETDPSRTASSRAGSRGRRAAPPPGPLEPALAAVEVTMTYIEYVELVNAPRMPHGLLGPLPAARYYLVMPDPAPPLRRSRPAPAPAPSRVLPQRVQPLVPDRMQPAAESLARDAERAELRQRFFPLPPGWAPAERVKVTGWVVHFDADATLCRCRARSSRT